LSVHAFRNNVAKPIPKMTEIKNRPNSVSNKRFK
jgi:hypothetical protein